MMVKIAGLLMVGLLLTSCSAGGGTVAGGGLRLQGYWPELGVDRYEAVVYPAEPGRP